MEKVHFTKQNKIIAIDIASSKLCEKNSLIVLRTFFRTRLISFNLVRRSLKFHCEFKLEFNYINPHSEMNAGIIILKKLIS